MSCKVYPQIRNSEGQLVDSQLYKDLLKYTQDRELTNIIYAMTIDPTIQGLQEQAHFDAIKEMDSEVLKQQEDKYFLQEEPSLQEVIDNFNLDEIVSEEAKTRELNMEISENREHNNVDGILQKAIDFNKSNQEYVAIIEKGANRKYSSRVEVKNDSNTEIANEQTAQSVLNDQLISILNEVGVGVDTNYQSATVHGMFDPLNAYKTAEGLKVMIKIANNELGKQALAEEFSHFAIEALGNEPLVHRLLKLVGEGTMVEDILGEDYTMYQELYEGDQNKMVKEAAGKLLAKHIKTDVSTQSEYRDVSTQSEYRNVLNRLWQRIKQIFSKLKISDVNTAVQEANEIASQLNKGIKDGSLISYMDIELASQGQTLYKADRTLDRLNKITNDILESKINLIQVHRNRVKGKKFSLEESKKVEALQKDIADNNYIKGLTDFLIDASHMIKQSQRTMSSLYSDGVLDIKGTLQEQRRIAHLLRNIKDFNAAYKSSIQAIQNLGIAVERGEIQMDLDIASDLTNSANEIAGIMKTLDADYYNVSLALMHNILSPIFGEDKIVPHGKNKGTIIKLSELLKTAHKDINFINHFFDSVADSEDFMLTMFDKYIKAAKFKVKEQVDALRHDIRIIHNTLINKGEKNTSFMFDMDSDGNASGYYISDIDHVKFNDAREAHKQSLEDRNLSDEQILKEINKWQRDNTIPVLVDEVAGRWERIPRRDLYPSDALSKLNTAQRQYYDAFMANKVALDTLLPESSTYKYKAIQERNDTIEAAKNTKGILNKAKGLLSRFGDDIVRRESEVEYGSEEVIDESKRNEKKINILTDFSGNEVKRLPIYYTNMLKDMSRLSLDASGSLLHYGQMAINFQEMYKIVDILEVGRDVLAEREFKQYRGDSKLVKATRALGIELSKDHTIKGDQTRTFKKFDDLMNMQVYGRMKLQEGSFSMLGYEIDLAKLGDKASYLTSITALGLNFFSGINNVAIGKMQMLLEVAGREYFTPKDVLIADKNYFKDVGESLGELGKTTMTSKMGLMRELFNPSQRWDQETRRQEFHKSGVTRIFGKAGVHFMMNAGVHYLDTRAMLAYLNAYKVKDARGKKISLYDAYRVEKTMIDGKVVDANLVLKDGITKLNGEEITSADIMDISYKIGKINQSLYGIYNDADKSSIQKWVLGRLGILFRKWMVPHYNRRFKGTHYDMQLDQWRQGFHNTAANFIGQLIKEITQGQLNIAASWNTLTPHEQSNIRRALTEVMSFLGMSLTLFLMGSYKDRSTWAGRVVDYQLRRLHLQVGASWFIPMMITDGKHILQSPTAAMKTTNLILETLNVFDLFRTIEQGKYEGYTVWSKNFKQNVPLVGNVRKIFDITTDDDMYYMFRTAGSKKSKK